VKVHTLSQFVRRRCTLDNWMQSELHAELAKAEELTGGQILCLDIVRLGR
jgi:hypothetical protein